MFWIQFDGMYIHGDHIQMFKWENGRLYIYLVGAPTPEMFDDPDSEKFKLLRSTVSDEISRRRVSGR